MKHLLFFFSLILFPFCAFTQSIITKNTWVGQNREYLDISKKVACLQKGMEFQAFDVVKYVKNNYIILSLINDTIALQTQYHIVRISQDTLILSPEGKDFFELSEPDSQNQYVFVNAMLTYKFVKLHYETTTRYFKIILNMDSAKKSKVTITDLYSNETRIYKSPVSKKDYNRLIRILSSYDFSACPDEEPNSKCPNYSILEIQYDDQKKIFKRCTALPSNSKLGAFVREYIALNVGLHVETVRRK